MGPSIHIFVLRRRGERIHPNKCVLYCRCKSVLCSCRSKNTPLLLQHPSPCSCINVLCSYKRYFILLQYFSLPKCMNVLYSCTRHLPLTVTLSKEGMFTLNCWGSSTFTDTWVSRVWTARRSKLLSLVYKHNLTTKGLKGV